MAKLSLLKGSASQTVNVFIQDSTVTTGAGKAGLAYNTASLTAYYVRPKAASVAITLAAQTATGAWTSGGFAEIDATNMPGMYRLDIPDAAFATGVNSVAVMLKGATGMAPLTLEMELTGWDNQDAVRGGMTALPNAAAEAAGGLFTRGGGAGQINQTVNGLADSNLIDIAGAAIDPASPQLGTNVVNWKGSAAPAMTGDAYDALVAAVYGEPGQEAPPATTNLVTKIGYLYKFLRNKITQTADTLSVFNAGGTVVDHKAMTSDDDVTYTRGEIGTGP